MSKELFALIKSLSKSEKRHFKLFTSMHGKGDENNYVRFFDVIEQQKEYDEEKLIKTEKYISDLSVIKVRLYNAILRSLRTYNANISFTNKLKAEIDYIEILRDKGLLEQAEKMVAKAKKKAEKYGQLLSLLQIMELEDRLMRRKNYYNVPFVQVEQVIKTMLSTVEKYKNQTEYLLLDHQLYLGPDSTKKRAMKDRLLSDEKEAQTYQALFSFYLCYCQYYEYTGDRIQIYNFRKKLVSLMEKHPHNIELIPERYIACLGNLINSQNQLKKFDEAFQTIQKLKALPENFPSLNENARNRLFIITNSVELVHYNNQGKFEKGIEVVKQIKSKFHIYEGTRYTLSDFIHINYSISIVYFGSEEYNMAIKHINNIINRQNIDYRSDVYSMAKVLSIIIYYELGHAELLQYAVRSTFRYLQKRNILYKTDHAILNFIRKKIPKINSKKELIAELIIFRDEVEKIRKKESEEKRSQTDFILCWAESKITGKHFAKVVKEKALEKNS
ncbi:MAG: hypothetical protein HYU69_00080 [Bacteroidetes bacterium]|nr:hypothetical protein [Bacteroidota bacterium]